MPKDKDNENLNINYENTGYVEVYLKFESAKTDSDKDAFYFYFNNRSIHTDVYVNKTFLKRLDLNFTLILISALVERYTEKLFAKANYKKTLEHISSVNSVGHLIKIPYRLIQYTLEESSEIYTKYKFLIIERLPQNMLELLVRDLPTQTVFSEYLLNLKDLKAKLTSLNDYDVYLNDVKQELTF